MTDTFLDKETFRTVVDSAPLVSIDLVIRNPKGKILLGKRVNRPAQGDWFVPGGRILKNESVAVAFERLVLNELNIQVKFKHASYVGLYDHFYLDSIWGEGVSTHYLVNAFEIKVDRIISLPDQQHNDYRWFSVEELLNSSEVHEHTKWYFTEGRGYS